MLHSFVLGIGFCIFCQVGLDHSPSIYTSCIVRTTGMDRTNFLPGLALNYDPPDLCLSSSWDCRSETPYLASSLWVSCLKRVVAYILPSFLVGNNRRRR
jgi:hypothetical protein